MDKLTGRRVFLFSGHMIDHPDRTKPRDGQKPKDPRFPPRLEPAVAGAIQADLADLAAGPADAAVCSAAAGSDILFDEAVLARGVPLRIYLPFDVPTFLEESVRFAGERWVERFHHVTARSEVFLAPQVLGPRPEGKDPYERTNLWMLDEARRLGSDVLFLCVWDGSGGDGPGGTEHMIESVGKEHARRIDIGKL
jgi:hypothetical protein